MLKQIAMRRFTARLLLLLSLIGVFVPVGQAFSGKPPHACCLRRLLARANREKQICAPVTPNGNCCPPLVSSQSAQVVGRESVSPLPVEAGLAWGHAHSFLATFVSLGFSDRAPPA